jgi:DNA-directed RNA polymerase I, II, and III subunit RPABC1
MERSPLTSAAYRLFRIRRTVCAMLTKRNYVVLDEDAHMKVEDFAAAFGGDIPNREKLGLLVFKADAEDEKLFVFFPGGDVGVPQCKECGSRARGVRARAPVAHPLRTPSTPLRRIITRMLRESVKRAILVISGKFSNFAKQTLAEVGGDLTIEHFLENELLVDITEHELVPEHVVLSDAEKAALLARYKLKEAQLPRIQLGDPVARFFGMQRGQVVKIIRPSETAGRYVTYRVVV